MNSIFTGIKDLDFYILSKLNNDDILILSLTNKNNYIFCNDETFWRNRFINKYNYRNNISTSWKLFYLKVDKYSKKYTVNKSLHEAAFQGDQDLVYYFIHKGGNCFNMGMAKATLGGHRDLIDFFISKGAKYWRWGLKRAKKIECQDLIDFFQEKLDIYDYFIL